MSDIKVIADRDEIVAIADAVRSKTGTTGEMTLSGIVNGVNSITTQPTIQSLSITENGTYTAPAGVDGYSPVTVNVASSGGAANLETWSGRVFSSNYPTVYYTNENGEAASGSSFETGSSWFRMNAAANTYILIEGFQSSWPISFNCEIVGCYEFAAIGGYAILVKPTANDFRVQEDGRP